MKSISLLRSKPAKFGFAGFVAAVASSVNAFAEQDLANAVLTDTSERLSGLVVNLVSVLQVGLGIAALVTVVFVVINILKGEREAASKIAWWVVGLAIGFGALTVVAALIK